MRLSVRLYLRFAFHVFYITKTMFYDIAPSDGETDRSHMEQDLASMGAWNKVVTPFLVKIKLAQCYGRFAGAFSLWELTLSLDCHKSGHFKRVLFCNILKIKIFFKTFKTIGFSPI